MSRCQNQHNIIPEDLLHRHMTYAWELGLNDEKAVQYIRDKLRGSDYTLSLKTYRRRRKEWGLHSATHNNKILTDTELTTMIHKVLTRYKYIGYRALKDHLRIEMKIRVPRDRIRTWFHTHAPELVKQRKMRRFKRQPFVAAGVNHIWAVDQHDKWQRFGLYLHLGTEVFSGQILWLKIWWTNKNPRLICGYYLEVVRALQAIPLLTQSDPGTENFGMANAQTTMRHRLDPSLEGTLQHRFKHKKTNIKPEIQWSLLRRHFSPGFEDVLAEGLDRDLYNPMDDLQQLVWRWIAIPWLQAELDIYRQRRNQSARRKDPHKVLPTGIPDLIFHEPHNYNNSLDFRIAVANNLIDEAASLWAPPEHEVFELVPAEFALHARQIFSQLDFHPVCIENFWQIFLGMSRQFQELQFALPPRLSASPIQSSEPIILISAQPCPPQYTASYNGTIVELQPITPLFNTSAGPEDSDTESSEGNNSEQGSFDIYNGEDENDRESEGEERSRLVAHFTDDEDQL